jgi:hypothetical protein
MPGRRLSTLIIVPLIFIPSLVSDPKGDIIDESSVNG